MSATQELADAVRTRAQGTPYVVEETPTGFDVRLRLEDPQLFPMLRELRLVEADVHHVRTDEGRRTCSIEDELRTLTWQAGPDGRERPTFGASRAVARGRIRTRSVQRTYSLGAGGVTRQPDRGFDSGVGRDLVTQSATALGWRLERGVREKIGLFVALGTVALLVLAGIVVGVVALAGGFS